jgi:hypothetical protein
VGYRIAGKDVVVEAAARAVCKVPDTAKAKVIRDGKLNPILCKVTPKTRKWRKGKDVHGGY